MQEEIYFDNSATTRPYDEVIDLMCQINREVYGNPSSLHRKGIEAEKILKCSREAISKALGANLREIYFTSGGTEANNIAILGFLKANPRGGKHIITSKIEHPAVLEVLKSLKSDYKVDFLNVDIEGKIDLGELEELITEDTALVSIMAVNNEVGSIEPLSEIVKIVKRKNQKAVIHVDAVQAFGKMPIDVKKLGIDMLSLSGHKIHGPKGIGALFIDEKRKVLPILYGGGQEMSLRSGTENVPAIGGLGLAAERASNNVRENFEFVTKLREHFKAKIEECIPEAIFLSPKDSLPYILAVSFPRLKAEVLLHFLEERNIYVSTGSACSSKKNTHSHVLTSMGFKANSIEGAIRFSFSKFNTIEEIDTTMDVLKEVIPKIQFKTGGRR